MNEFLPYTRHHFEYALQLLHKAVYTPVSPLNINAYRTREPLPFSQRQEGEELILKPGDIWGELFDSAWFHFTGTVPSQTEGQSVVLLLDVSGEMCVFDTEGVPVRGLTNAASEYDFRLGRPGKRVLPLLDSAKGGETVDIWADAGCNDLFGRIQNQGAIQEASIAIVNPDIRSLLYDFEILLDCLQVLPENSPRALEIAVALHEVTHIIWKGFNSQAVLQARSRLQPVLERKGGDPSLKISAVGHAHIDLGWLWPIRETHRKGARTFSTALANMELYPEYMFAASQAQLFEWIKQDHPILYSKIKQKVKEGRLEPQGALWVECDTNVTSGESMIRQILYGKQFFRQEFNIDPEYIWLPDTFGYTAALPQLILRSGMKYFSTQKLSWSQINRFPYHSFHWQGLDGSSILVHMLPEETYNSAAAPRAIRKIEENYSQKGISEHALMIYGIGDGGGGPGEEHLERLKRLKDLAGFSPVTQKWTSEFFKEWEVEAGKFPTWVGELYLERHQGTLTTSARSKRHNRQMEQSLRFLEWLGSIGAFEGVIPYPSQPLESIWKEVLLYQFHDILPGSSIKRVYDESLSRYEVLSEEVAELIKAAETSLFTQVNTQAFARPVVVVNSLSWDRHTWIKVDQTWMKVQVPSMGYSTVDLDSRLEAISGLTATQTRLENDRLCVIFGENGSITSILDKTEGREIVPANEQANRLAVFGDPGDAWDIPMDYADVKPDFMQIREAKAWLDGPRVVLQQTYQYGHSELVQEISLLAGSAVIEFDTSLHWIEPNTMLRVMFPTTIFAEDASFEIQFGHVSRPTHTNTSWDLAKDEVPAHKWVDLSQRDYGVALLNDCKYGHRIKGHTLELNLLRSVLYPGTRVVPEEAYIPGEPFHAYTDQGDHKLRYALYPHQGDLVVGNVIKEAYEFNYPLRLCPIEPHGGKQPPARSFFSLSQPNIIIETVKQAQDGAGVIVRLYEAWRMKTKVELKIGFQFHSATEANLIEEEGEVLEFNGDSIPLAFEPFEIKTILLE